MAPPGFRGHQHTADVLLSQRAFAFCLKCLVYLQLSSFYDSISKYNIRLIARQQCTVQHNEWEVSSCSSTRRHHKMWSTIKTLESQSTISKRGRKWEHIWLYSIESMRTTWAFLNYFWFLLLPDVWDLICLLFSTFWTYGAILWLSWLSRMIIFAVILF